MRQLQFHLQQMMIGFWGCAMISAALFVERFSWLLFFVGPICGALIQRKRGGRGVVGGILGGVITYVGFGVVMYAKAYFYPSPITSDYLGPVLSFGLLAFCGTAIGLVVGVIMWGLMVQIEDQDSRYPWWSTPEESKPKMPDRN